VLRCERGRGLPAAHEWCRRVPCELRVRACASPGHDGRWQVVRSGFAPPNRTGARVASGRPGVARPRVGLGAALDVTGGGLV
jgi:hypothetical protein